MKLRVGTLSGRFILSAAILEPNGNISHGFTSSEYNQAVNFITETAENVEEQAVCQEKVMVQCIKVKHLKPEQSPKPEHSIS